MQLYKETNNRRQKNENVKAWFKMFAFCVRVVYVSIYFTVESNWDFIQKNSNFVLHGYKCLVYYAVSS